VAKVFALKGSLPATRLDLDHWIENPSRQPGEKGEKGRKKEGGNDFHLQPTCCCSECGLSADALPGQGGGEEKRGEQDFFATACGAIFPA